MMPTALRESSEVKPTRQGPAVLEQGVIPVVAGFQEGKPEMVRSLHWDGAAGTPVLLPWEWLCRRKW